MSRTEADREDLMREATALIERAEFRLPQFPDAVVVGFRRNGAGSVYIGQHSVYQFNAEGHWRRGFFDKALLKAEEGCIVSMTRHRTPERTELISRPLSYEQSEPYRQSWRRFRKEMLAALRDKKADLIRQHPSPGKIVGRITDWLDQLPAELEVAASPHVESRGR